MEDSYFRGSEDGCIDTRVGNMLIRSTVAAECKRNLRLWQSVTPGPRVESVSSYQPRDAHFFMRSGQTTARSIAVHSSNGARLVAYDCDTQCLFHAEDISGTAVVPAAPGAFTPLAPGVGRVSAGTTSGWRCRRTPRSAGGRRWPRSSP
ncbi:hypothetical protein [Hyalangium gracile]|uniref:hypothetical protein n=1 Tax=Hyalangium gracile TaxID=394092 RepID=UPI001CCE2A81|nr:hypothetical protein [Hyalangium gracile]